MVILEFDFKSLDDKIVNSDVSLLKTQAKNVKLIFGDAVASILRAFRERWCFSLEYREIRLSTVFGTRRKNVLRRAGYA